MSTSISPVARNSTAIGILPNPQPVQGTNTVRSWGLQLAKFSGVVVGQPVTATIRIESFVPEPATAALVGLAMLGLVGFGRRRNG